MLEVTNVSKKFKSGDGVVTAVNDVSFSVPDGVFAAIVGKSGSGKTTLLGLLGALDQPTSGTISVGGETINQQGDHALVKYRLRRIGFVFQGYNLVPNLSALENVMLPMEFAGTPGAERKTRAAALLKQVGLDTTKQSRKPTHLSGGEQQRVAIARALANRPQLILADEPTGNLDSATGQVIVDLLKHLAKTERTTVVAVTHDQEIAAEADITFKLQDGKLVGEERRHGHGPSGSAVAADHDVPAESAAAKPSRPRRTVRI